MTTDNRSPRSETKSKKPQLTAEQALATTLTAPYLLVSASAGTGKTWTLVQRVMNLIRGGGDLERLLIITFTHKAADELKDRLFSALNQDPSLRPLRLRLPQMNISTIHAFCARLLREYSVDAGIDPGFRVISETDNLQALEEIMDNIFHHWYTGDASAVRERGVHQEFLRLVDLCRYRGSREELRTELLKLLSLARATCDPDQFIDQLQAGLEQKSPPYLPDFTAMLHETWRQALSTYRRMLNVAADQYPDKKTDKHHAAMAAFDTAPAPWNVNGETGLQALAADLPGAITALRKHLHGAGLLIPDSAWKLSFPRLPHRTTELKPYNDFVKHLIGGGNGPFGMIPADPAEIVSQYGNTRQALETMIELLKQVMVRYETYKGERGLLDFSDLELKTRQLLLNPPTGLLERFDMVIVDEFQDVNRLQASIVKRLQPANGRFLVGDIKQCIYQFRLSDPSIFRELFVDATIVSPETPPPMPAPAQTRLYMSQNFRSRRPVLELVNQVFKTLFTPAMIGGDYQAEALRYFPAPEVNESGDETSRGHSPTEIHLFTRAKAGAIGGISVNIYREANLVARRIKQLMAEEFPVYERGKDWRPVRYSDMAIILRSPNANGGPFAEILTAAGIPVDFGTQGFFARSEVRDFLCLLRVLDNAHDDIALAAVLGGPTTEFQLEDLLTLRLQWPESLSLYAGLKATALNLPDAWSGPRAPETAPGFEYLSRKCLKFINQLAGWRRRIQATDLPTAAAAILDQSGLLEYATAAVADSDPRGNLEQLITLARTYSQNRDHGLPGFIQYLTEMESTGDGPESLRPPAGGTDAVRILSLHKSKGLEFPVVFLALYGKKFNDQDTFNKLLTGASWIGIDQFDPSTYRITPTISHWTLAQLRKRQIREEEMRIIYVALTRAREKLIITGHLSKNWSTQQAELALWCDEATVPDALRLKGNCPLDWLLGTLSRAGLFDELPPAGACHRPNDWLELRLHDPETEPSPIAPPDETTLEPEPAAAAPTAAPAAAPTAAPIAAPAAAPAVTGKVTTADLRDLAVRLQTPYRFGPATRWRGKYWVTEIKQLLDAQRHADEYAEGSDLSVTDSETADQRPGGRPRDGLRPAAGEGTWLHTVLEAVATDAATKPDILATATRLGEMGQIPADWISPESIAPVFDFFASPLGVEMCAARALSREASFSLKLTPLELSDIWPEAAELAAEEWILIQGQIDAIWQRDDGSWLVLDFKSDRVDNEKQLAQRVAGYRPQLMLYREAAARIWRAETIDCRLHFLRAGKSIRV